MSILKKIFGRKRTEINQNLNKDSSKNDERDQGKSVNSNEKTEHIENQSSVSNRDDLINKKEDEGSFSIGKNLYFELVNTHNEQVQLLLQDIPANCIFDFFEEIKVIMFLAIPNGKRSYVNTKLFNELQTSPEELYNLCLRNLIQSNNGALQMLDLNSSSMVFTGIKRLVIGSPSDASLVLVSSIWKRYSEQLNSQKLIFSFPSSKVLLVSSFSDFNSLLGHKALLKDYFENQNNSELALYDKSIMWNAGEWMKIPENGEDLLDIIDI